MVILDLNCSCSMNVIILNYEAWLCYYDDDISSNSQVSRMHCYGQMVCVLQKTAIHELPVCVRLSFCP